MQSLNNFLAYIDDKIVKIYVEIFTNNILCYLKLFQLVYKDPFRIFNLD